MRTFRPRLSYANVVATLALFLALSGGAVWAAGKIKSGQIGKGAVKNKNLAKNAVKAKNLAKKSVTTAKLADGAVTNPKLGEGAVNFAKIAAGTNVIATATAGPVSAKQDGPVNLALNPPLSVTPVAGQPLTVNIEARSTLTQTAGGTCSVAILPFVNGNFLLIGELFGMASPDIPPEPPPFAGGFPQADVSFPVGLTQPGKPQSITLQMFGDATDCTAGSTVDQVAVVVTQAK
jgi:hypothetical protein